MYIQDHHHPHLFQSCHFGKCAECSFNSDCLGSRVTYTSNWSSVELSHLLSFASLFCFRGVNLESVFEIFANWLLGLLGSFQKNKNINLLKFNLWFVILRTICKMNKNVVSPYILLWQMETLFWYCLRPLWAIVSKRCLKSFTSKTKTQIPQFWKQTSAVSTIVRKGEDIEFKPLIVGTQTLDSISARPRAPLAVSLFCLTCD